jgi:probable rRNA maturation factor
MDNVNTPVDKVNVSAVSEANVNVLLFVESRYKVSRKKIKSVITQTLKEQDIHGPVEISVAIVGDRKMRQLYKKYKGEDKTTNVLSFPIAEGDAMVLPNDVLRLGDIVLSYPQVIREASEDNVLVDDKVSELVRHSVFHLLGIHH